MRYIAFFFLLFYPVAAIAQNCDVIARAYNIDICAPVIPLEGEDSAWLIMDRAFYAKFGAEAKEPSEDEKNRLLEHELKICVISKRAAELPAKEASAFMIQNERNKNFDVTSSPHYEDCRKADFDQSSTLSIYRIWKMNKVLWTEYGGGVAFQQFGLEPHPAWRKFIDNMKTEGGLKIYKAEYQNAFDPMIKYMDGFSHLSSEEEARDYFKEFWLLKAE